MVKSKWVFPKKFIFWIIGSGIVSSLAGFSLAYFWHNPSSKAWLEIEFWQQWLRFGETLRISNTEYHDSNSSNFRKLTDKAITGMVSSLDRHSSYYTPEQYKAFQEDSHRQYFGIGIMIRKIDRGVLVSKVFENGPAEVAGLEVGDFIIKVDGQSIEGQELNDISSQIKGVAGSLVNVEVIRKEKTFSLDVNRGQIQVSTVDQYYVDENKTGYIHLIQFSSRTSKEMAHALKEMQSLGLQRLILDLRDNSGGLLSSAIEVAAFFLPDDQLVVELKGRDVTESRMFRTQSRNPQIKVPMVVLINESSASASEIVAGALSILGRAKTLGEKSYGKGSVQTIFKLSDNSGLRLTTAMYYLPDGSTIHEQGIAPHILVECSDENESKLRVQRNMNSQLIDEHEFNNLFGFTVVKDQQLLEAERILLNNEKDNND
jgi:carboxyl-terminal processing protease